MDRPPSEEVTENDATGMLVAGTASAQEPVRIAFLAATERREVIIFAVVVTGLIHRPHCAALDLRVYCGSFRGSTWHILIASELM
jgi:hypothetical protein